MKITGKAVGEEMGKRNYWASGFSLKGSCPECGESLDTPLEGDCVNYPVIGESYDYPMYCGECDHEFNVPIVFNITAKIGK